MYDLVFEVGDTVWFYHTNHKGNKTSGKVIHKVQLPGYSFVHYIIEIPTDIDPLLIIREGWTLSEAEHKEIGLYRGIF